MDHTVAGKIFTKWIDNGSFDVPQLARLLGVDRSTVYRWRRGEKRPDRRRAVKIQVLSNDVVPARAWYPEVDDAERLI